MQELGGSRARQLAQAGQWKCSIPWTPCSVYEWRLTGGQEGICSTLLHEFESSLVQEFEYFWEFREFCDFWHFVITAWGLSATWLSGGEKNCIVYSLCCILIMIIIIIIFTSSVIISVSIYFVVILNCLYLSPWVLPFVHFSLVKGRGKGEWAAVWCLVPSCWVKLQHMSSPFMTLMITSTSTVVIK